MRFLLLFYYCVAFFLTASSSSSSSAEISAEPQNLSTRIFSVKGRNNNGLEVNGIIFYTNHSEKAKEVFPETTRAYIQDKEIHLISECDIFNQSVFDTPYHLPADFVREGYIDPEFCFPSGFNSYEEIFESHIPGSHEGKPLWSMLHPGRLVSQYYQAFQYGFYSAQYESIEDAGIDTWLISNWEHRKTYLHVLEDELDRDIAHRLDPEENFLGWRDTSIRDADIGLWTRIFKLIINESKTSNYQHYKEEIFKSMESLSSDKPEKITLLQPSLTKDTHEISYVEQTMELQTVFPTGYCKDPSMVYRNSLWVDRLDKIILPRLNGAPFILDVGFVHQFVESEDGSKMGIHDYFEHNFGQGCLKPITAAEIPEYFSSLTLAR